MLGLMASHLIFYYLLLFISISYITHSPLILKEIIYKKGEWEDDK